MLDIRIVMLVFIFLCPSGAYALSCKGMSDRIIASCSYTACDNIIYISEVSSRLACARRPVVVDTPVWAQNVLEYEISRKESFDGRKIFELIIKKQYWGADLTFENATEYIEQAEGARERDPRAASTLNELTERDINKIEKMWKSKESKSLLIDRAWIAADWIGFLASLFLLVLSVVYFNGWANKHRSVNYLALSLVMQGGIFSTMFWLSMWHGFLVQGLAFLVPGIWFYQINILVRKFYMTKKRTKAEEINKTNTE